MGVRREKAYDQVCTDPAFRLCRSQGATAFVLGRASQRPPIPAAHISQRPLLTLEATQALTSRTSSMPIARGGRSWLLACWSWPSLWRALSTRRSNGESCRVQGNRTKTPTRTASLAAVALESSALGRRRIVMASDPPSNDSSAVDDWRRNGGSSRRCDEAGVSSVASWPRERASDSAQTSEAASLVVRARKSGYEVGTDGSMRSACA